MNDDLLREILRELVESNKLRREANQFAWEAKEADKQEKHEKKMRRDDKNLFWLVGVCASCAAVVILLTYLGAQ